jgi:hypothetical protein
MSSSVFAHEQRCTSTSCPPHSITHAFQFSHQPFSLVALNLDASILDRPACAALLFQPGGEFE